MHNLWTRFLEPFFNSQFFSGLATILTVGGAILVYKLQKGKEKQQIAILLINDIRNAHSAITSVKDALHVSGIPELPEVTILSENNWSKYSYLFSKDFDQDETALINKYFSDIERLNYIVTQANNMFLLQVSERTAALQKENLRIIADSETIKKMIERLSKLDRFFADVKTSTSPYIPVGFYDKLKKYMPEVPDLLNTPVGEKLKNIAEKKIII
jgi:hypothetical protein